jgi:hypothetical protein
LGDDSNAAAAFAQSLCFAGPPFPLRRLSALGEISSVPSALAGAAVDSDDRVRVESLEAHTTYYCKVDSEAADGTSDGVNGALKTFTTP